MRAASSSAENGLSSYNRFNKVPSTSNIKYTLEDAVCLIHVEEVLVAFLEGFHLATPQPAANYKQGVRLNEGCHGELLVAGPKDSSRFRHVVGIHRQY